MLKFPGKRPNNLGARNGRFTATPSWKPNWVSSQVAAEDSHYIAPLVQDNATQALQKLKSAMEKMERVVLVAARADYLHAEFSTAGLGFTDDVELCADGTVLHLRSSSRLGIRDFGVNRKRAEALRAVLQG